MASFFEPAGSRRQYQGAIPEIQSTRPLLEAAGDPLGCYFKTDPHWNARGHAIAGRELFKVIQERAPK